MKTTVAGCYFVGHFGKISAQPHTFIMHTVLCLKKTIAVTIARICKLLALEKVYFFSKSLLIGA